MKKKKSRILGVALTLMLVASLFGFAVPVAAVAPSMSWGAQTIPTTTNNVIFDASDVGDIAVSGDGTIYITNLDDGMTADLPGSVLKSTNGGQSFTALTAVGGGAANFLTAIAVAPDDSDAVIVSDNATAFVTTDGGTTWTALPAKLTGGDITDVDVSAAIAGAFGGRHYVITVANPTTLITTGRAEIYGPGATWTLIGVVGAGDYMACKFSPSYMGDRALALVWNAGAGVTNLSIITQPGETAEALTRTSAIGTTSIDYDSSAGGIVINSQAAWDIALPSDWDPTITAGEVTYVSVASTAGAVGAGVAGRGGAVAIITSHATDDVYRIDAGVPTDLNGSNTVPVHSIAYSGTIDDGTLFLGRRLEPNVRYTLNPTSMAPTWKTTQKPPTGDNIALPEACTKVVVAPNGDIYAGTRDSWTVASAVQDRRSAFSVSTDAGVTFNQTAMIDVGAGTLVLLDDVMPTPDGLTIFMSSDDGTDLSLWKSAIPTGATTWERIYIRAASAGPGIIRLGSDYADNPSIFWADTAGVAALWISHDGGSVFYNRTPPALIVDLAIESGGSAGVLYMANGNNIYKSTNGGSFFGLAIPSLLVGAGITSLSTAPMYPATPEAGHLIVGGPTEVSYSIDGTTSFSRIAVGLAGAGNTVVGADEAYVTNNTIYAAGVTSGTVYRFAIGTDTTWTNLTVIEAGVAGTSLRGIGMSNGTLYAADLTINVGVYRTLTPLAAAGTLVWEAMDTGTAVGATFAKAPNALRVVNNVLWAVDTTAAAPGELEAYDDFIATAVPVLTGPADGASVSVDPVTGRADLVVLAWEKMGSGTGLVDNYDIWLTTVDDVGWDAAQTDASRAVTDAGAPRVDTTTAAFVLRANTEYMWRVRAEDTVSVDDIRGLWSESRSLIVQAGTIVQAPQAGVILLGPAAGAVDVSLTPGFSWAPIAGATQYEFILATDAALTLTVEGTPVYVTIPAWQVPATTLEYDTTYFWGVKATLPTESVQSIGTFTTMSEAVVTVYTCAFCDETFATEAELSSHIAAIHPTPTPPTPAYIWAIIVVGAILMITVLVLIMRTRRVV